MKVRNGFVSNNSSSPYLILYNKVEIKQLPERVQQGSVYAMGKDLCDGVDFFLIEENMVELIQSRPKEFRLYDVVAMRSDVWDDHEIDLRLANGASFATTLEVDQHSSQDLSDLIDRYQND